MTKVTKYMAYITYDQVAIRYMVIALGARERLIF